MQLRGRVAIVVVGVLVAAVAASTAVPASAETITSQSTSYGTTTLTATTSGEALSPLTITATVLTEDGVRPDGDVEFDINVNDIHLVSDVSMSDGTASYLDWLPRAGSYIVWVRYLDLWDHGIQYGANSPAPISFTLARVPVTITARDQHIVYGDADPSYTATVSGGDPSWPVPPYLDWDCTVAGPHADAGTYPIGCSATDLAHDSYAITLVPGTLTVDRAPVIIAAPAVSRTASLQSKLVSFSASLTSAETGAPVPDVPVTFTAATVLSKPLISCAATTDSQGEATCTTKNTTALLLATNYRISVPQTTDYLASTTNAPVTS